MSRTKHHRNWRNSPNRLVDLWNKRPLAGERKNAENKRMSRRLERARAKRELTIEACDE